MAQPPGTNLSEAKAKTPMQYRLERLGVGREYVQSQEREVQSLNRERAKQLDLAQLERSRTDASRADPELVASHYEQMTFHLREANRLEQQIGDIRHALQINRGEIAREQSRVETQQQNKQQAADRAN